MSMQSSTIQKKNSPDLKTTTKKPNEQACSQVISQMQPPASTIFLSKDKTIREGNRNKLEQMLKKGKKKSPSQQECVNFCTRIKVPDKKKVSFTPKMNIQATEIAIVYFGL